MCGHGFSVSTITGINKGLDEILEKLSDAVGGNLSLSYSGCALREDARGWSHPFAGGGPEVLRHGFENIGRRIDAMVSLIHNPNQPKSKSSRSDDGKTSQASQEKAHVSS